MAIVTPASGTPAASRTSASAATGPAPAGPDVTVTLRSALALPPRPSATVRRMTKVPGSANRAAPPRWPLPNSQL
ncbi:MAG: hypothetical protein ABIQ06_09780 [Caldimonas sp.]